MFFSCPTIRLQKLNLDNSYILRSFCAFAGISLSKTHDKWDGSLDWQVKTISPPFCWQLQSSPCRLGRRRGGGLAPPNRDWDSERSAVYPSQGRGEGSVCPHMDNWPDRNRVRTGWHVSESFKWYWTKETWCLCQMLLKHIKGIVWCSMFTHFQLDILDS